VSAGEGWGVIRPGDRKAHYYRDTMSLCRRVGFDQGPLEPDEHASKDDCAACRKVLTREAAKRGQS
jgi:DNA polymerase III epsilon subunit-like protein